MTYFNRHYWRVYSSILIIRLEWRFSNVNRSNKNKETRSGRYSTDIMIDADSADDLALHTNTHAQAEFLLNNLLRAARDIYFSVNKTEFMGFKPGGVISTLCGKPPKLVDTFTYLDSNISSTESNVNISIRKG